MRDTILSSYLTGFMEDFGYKAQNESEQFELFSSCCTVCHAFTDNFEVEKSIIGNGGILESMQSLF